MSDLNSIARLIADRVATIDNYMQKHGLASPSFDVDSPSALPADPIIQKARLDLIEAGLALKNLATGSADLIRWQVLGSKYDDMCLHFLAEYKVFDAVPLSGSITYHEVAEKVGLSESRLRRILRHAFTNHFFYSPEPDRVAHTSNSKVIAHDPLAIAWIMHNVAEVEPWYSTNAVAAYKRWGDSVDPKHTGANVQAEPGAEKDLFQILEQDEDGEWGGVQGRGWMLKRFGDSDKFMASGGALKASDLHVGFDWESLGETTVVDICGSAGHVSLELASKHPRLSFIVQDKPSFQDQFEALVPTEKKSHISFQPYSIFTPEPIQGAGVYFLRGTLHKFPDPLAITIIKNIAGAMTPNFSRLITMDVVMHGSVQLDSATSLVDGGVRNGSAKSSPLPGLGDTGAITRLNTSIDMQMMTVLNARERTLQEWIQLFSEADDRFVLKACKQPLGNSACILEWIIKE